MSGNQQWWGLVPIKSIWIEFNLWFPVRWSARHENDILLSRNICAVNVWCMIRIGFSQGLSRHDHQNIYKCKNFLHCLDNLPARADELENIYWTYLIDLRPILGPPQFSLSLLCPPKIILECLIKIGRVSRKWKDRKNIQSEMKYLAIAECAKIWKGVMLQHWQNNTVTFFWIFPPSP